MGRFDGVNPRRANLGVWLRILIAIGALLLLERVVFYYRAFSTTTGPKKAIVAASTIKDDTTWIKKHFGKEWEVNIYVADDTSADLTVYKNTGREASVYLTYIINHYWSLPEVIVFSHGTRYQWHNDDPMFDGIVPLKNLNLNYVRTIGYTNLRCDWYPACPISVEPNTTITQYPTSDEIVGDGFAQVFTVAYRELFPDHKEVPEAVAHLCCGQFAVTREQIHKKPPAFYEHIRQWIWTNNIDAFQAGRVVEHIWHIMFGKEAWHCPNAAECYCKLYGLCDLICPEAPEGCNGRFWETPFWVDTNENWPKEGQGKDGYPNDNWWLEYYPTDVYDGFKVRSNATLPADAYRATAVPGQEQTRYEPSTTKSAEPTEVDQPAETSKNESPAVPAGKPAPGKPAEAGTSVQTPKIEKESMPHGLRRPSDP